jgi:hypothetical protein
VLLLHGRPYVHAFVEVAPQLATAATRSLFPTCGAWADKRPRGRHATQHQPAALAAEIVELMDALLIREKRSSTASIRPWTANIVAAVHPERRKRWCPSAATR